MRHSKFLSHASIFTIIAVTGLATHSIAEAQIDEIIVTAQKTEANLQDVPVAITAISTVELEQKQIGNVLDLQNHAPNIFVVTGTGTANSGRIALRGIGEGESRGAVDPAVGTYVDGVYLGRQVGSLMDVVDLERIEVLRGPQGTLYGRSTNGGAIKLVSVKPQQEESLSAKVTYGNYNRLDIRGTGNYAFSDSTAVRVTGLYRKRDGFFDVNPNGAFAGQATEKVGDLDTFVIRGMLSQDFADNWNVLLAADYMDDNSDPIPGSPAPIDRDGNLFTVEPQPGVTCAQDTIAPIAPFDFRPIGCFNAFGNKTKAQGYSATITGQLGSFDVQSITSFRRMDDDLSSHIGNAFAQQTDQEQLSQELTLSSNFEGPFNFVAGGYYYHEDFNLDTIFIFPHYVASDAKSFAVFGQARYDITDRLTVTGGARFTDEHKTHQGRNGTSNLFNNDSADFNNTSFTAKLAYDISDNVMAYGSYATGFKAGGWSPDCFSATACFLPVDEEKVGTIELGLRSQILDNRLQFNATYFDNDYDNLQISATVPGVGFTRFNVDKTAISGFEFEVKFQPNDRFQIDANLGLLNADYTSVTLPQAGGLTNNGVPCAGGIVTIDCALGLDVREAPEYKANISALYKLPISSGEITFGGDINFEADSYSLAANTPTVALSKIPTIMNARVAYNPKDSFWSASIWAKNITDEHYWRAATATGSTAFAAEPATYGVDFGFKF